MMHSCRSNVTEDYDLTTIDLSSLDIELSISSARLQKYVAELEHALSKQTELYGIEVPTEEIIAFRQAHAASMTGATKALRKKHTRLHFARKAGY